MLKKLKYSVSLENINLALNQLPSDEFRFTINRPTGNFFYDDWILKDEFVGTVWETIYDSLDAPRGEARIIKLSSKECYTSHSDIDDRYHLNLFSKKAFLIDLDNSIMHQLVTDGSWYEMSAGTRHSATNFGNRNRYQLVIRKLLNRSNLDNSCKISITAKTNVDPEDARFIFDDILSPWLNKADKNLKMNDFNYDQGTVTFELDAQLLEELKSILPLEFELTYL